LRKDGHFCLLSPEREVLPAKRQQAGGIRAPLFQTRCLMRPSKKNNKRNGRVSETLQPVAEEAVKTEAVVLSTTGKSKHQIVRRVRGTAARGGYLETLSVAEAARAGAVKPAFQAESKIHRANQPSSRPLK
jgi:6-phosphogluconolactonase/glucosamine-6-phosphate isomerase/deaminase